MKISINPSHVKKITLNDARLNPYNYFLVGRKGERMLTLNPFRKKYYDEDLYQAKGLGFMTKTENELKDENNIVIGGKVYIKPNVKIHYIDGTDDTVYFDTLQETEEYYGRFLSKLDLIIL